MKFLKSKITLLIVIGFTLLGTGTVDAATRVQFPHLTCYGTSQILYSSAVGVYGQSTTNCDTDLVTPARQVKVDGTLYRNGKFYKYSYAEQNYSNYVRSQQISSSEYKTGSFVLESEHFVQSSYNSSDQTSWFSRWDKTY